MRPRQIELVQESWAKIAPIVDTAAQVFYERLFALDPALRPMFKGDLAAQAWKLSTMISFAVKGLNRVEALKPGLLALGARHADFGVRDEHYQTVGQALLWTLGKGLGEAFTPETARAWASAYDLLASTMKQGAQKLAA
jgi:hemoglobin-like flavoprotein